MEDYNLGDFSQTLSNLYGGFVIISASETNKMLYMSKGVERLIGWNYDELKEIIANKCKHFISDADFTEIVKVCERSITWGHRSQYTLHVRTKSDDMCWVNMVVSPIFDDMYKGDILIVVNQVSEQFLANNMQIAEGRIRTETLLCVIYNKYDYIVRLNPRTFHARIFVTRPTERYPEYMEEANFKEFVRWYIMTKNKEYQIEIMYHNDATKVDIGKLIRDLEKYGNYEYNLKVTNRKTLEVSYKSLSMFYLNKSEETVIITQYDNTEVVKDNSEKMNVLVRTLNQAKEADKAKTEFLSRMSHEVRTPLNAILGFAELSVGDNQDVNAVYENVKKIHSAGTYLLNLLNGILDMSKIESGKMTLLQDRFSIKELLESLDMMMEGRAKQKGIEFVFEADNIEQAEVYGDKMKLNQVFVNLLDNAYKFTDYGGKIIFKAEQIQKEDEKIVICFKVIDNGIGMSEEATNRVFESFYQEDTAYSSTKRVGTGLGLAITKSIIDMMKGEITVESKPGEGTTFTVVVPFKNAKHKKEVIEEKNIESKLSLEGRRILMAEDYEMNAEVVRKMLEKKGMKVDIVVNGLEAIDKFSAHPNGYYDAILMDIRMPIMDGLEATQNIRKLENPDGSALPIIAMTADAFNDDVMRSAMAGMDGHLSKPVRSKDIYKMLEKSIAEYEVAKSIKY